MIFVIDRSLTSPVLMP